MQNNFDCSSKRIRFAVYDESEMCYDSYCHVQGKHICKQVCGEPLMLTSVPQVMLYLNLSLDSPVSALEWRGEVGAEKPLQTHMHLFLRTRLLMVFVF